MKAYGKDTFLTKFCNIDPMTGGGICRLMEEFPYRQDIFHHEVGSRVTYFRVRGFKDEIFFPQKQDYENYHKWQRPDLTAEEYSKTHHVDGSQKYFDGIQKLQDAQKNYRETLREIITEGEINPHRLNRFWENFSASSFRFVAAPDRWNPILVFDFGKLPKFSVQDIIEYNEILTPIYEHRGEIFSMLRQCPACGRFFIATARKNIFCRELCRVHLRRKGVKKMHKK